MAKRLCYSTQVEGASRPKLEVSSSIMAVALLFQKFGFVLDCSAHHVVPNDQVCWAT